MFRKYFFPTLFAVALWLSSVVGASAQMGALRGKVTLKKADGTIVPAVGAIIDVIRLDLTAKYEGKTDKKGEFVWAGLPYVGDYVIGVSMAGAQPTYQGNVKVGRDIDFPIEMAPGDGRRLSVEELRKLAKGGGEAGPPTKSRGESAEDKAKREELLKKNAEMAETNKKNQEINEVVNRTFKAGEAAMGAKNYDEAIKQFDEGIGADAEQTVLYRRKSDALRIRGVERYNESIKTKDLDKKELAKADFKQATEVAASAIAWAKKETRAADPAGQASQNSRMLAAMVSHVESMRLFVTIADPTQADAGMAAYQEYLAVETDPIRKARGERDAAKMLFDANAFDKALVAYQKILETSPDDLDALLKSGLALFNIGAINTDKTKYQEAANYLQRYIDKAPETEAQNKSDAKAIIDNLKDQENVKPEKITAPPRRTRRP